jgi:hypothetical protein
MRLIESSLLTRRYSLREKGMPEFIHFDELPREPFGGKTKGILRKSLSSSMSFLSAFNAPLILARPGGEFPEHVDS